MNIYYHRKQKLDIISFWKEILKMNIIPIALSIVTMVLLTHFDINSWRNLSISVIAFLVAYVPLFYFISMNKYERELIAQPLKKIIKR